MKKNLMMLKQNVLILLKKLNVYSLFYFTICRVMSFFIFCVGTISTIFFISSYCTLPF